MKTAGAVWWRNTEHLVQATLAEHVGCLIPGALPALWLRIYRHDGKRLQDHWNTLQAIKNELVGPEFEAVEIYPRESRLQDGENSYHLWVLLAGHLQFGMPFMRAESCDGNPAVSTRFVKGAKNV